MITVFNRAELFVTQSMEQYAKVTDALAAAGIEYTSKVISRSSGRHGYGPRMNTGTFGQSMAFEYTYYVYVKKCSFDAAGAAISAALR